MVLVDTNVLVALIIQNTPWHGQASELLNRDQDWRSEAHALVELSNVLLRLVRLRQWCDASDASVAESGPAYKFVYVDQPSYERNPPRTFAGLVAAFGEYQGG